MKQLKKPISIICQRIQNERIIWISFLICLVVIFAYHAISKECLLSQFSSLLNFISEYQTEIISLAISYIAGVIFYVFSVLIPYALNSRAILPDIVEELRYLKDVFYDLSSELIGKNWLDNDNYIDEAIVSIKRNSLLQANHYNLSNDYKSVFNDFINKVDGRIRYVQKYSVGYLTDDEMKSLLEINRSKILEHLREYAHNSYPVFSEFQLYQMINDLIEVNRKEVALYHKLAKRIYISEVSQ